MVPEEWTSHTFEDLFDFKNGLNTEAANYGSGTKFVNVMDVFDGSSLTQDRIRGSVKVNAKQLEAYALRRGDILFNRTSETPHEIAFASVYLDDAPAIFGGFVIRARPTTSYLHPEYSKYCFRAETIRRELIRRCQGAIRGNIGQTDMKDVPIYLPPFPEQVRIAEILSTWDRAIATVRNLIENSRGQKKAIAQRALRGEDQWGSARLGTVATLKAGGTPSTSKPEYWGGEVPWMSSGEINLRRVLDVEGRISDAGLANSSAKMLPINCVLVALAGQGATRGRVAINRISLSTNQSVAAIIPSPEIDAEYLFHNLESRYGELRSLSLGDGGRGGLNLRILKSLPVALPPIDKQKEIAKLLNIADSGIEKWSSFERSLQSEKVALMQQLLSGKRRVRLDQKDAKAATG